VRLVSVEPVIDPQAYLAALPELARDLPPGARAFALDDGHYDFYGTRCVKDLVVAGVRVADDGALGAVVELDPNEWKHDAGLVVRYLGLHRLTVEAGQAPPAGPTRLGSVVIDEIVPDAHGCRHEIACTGGTVVVVAADLEASWRVP
jgi:hypothetical protein